MTWGDRVYWLLRFPFGGLAAWLFGNTACAPWLSPYLMGVMIGRKPKKV